MIVYHYCNVERMFQILSGNELWLLNSRQMNDYAEGRWADAIISHVIEKEYSADDHRFKDLSIQYFLNAIPFYMSCFSEDGDSLSQWRAYTSDATGVALGFEIEETGILRSVPRPNVSPERSLGWAKVEYDESVQLETVRTILQEWVSEYKHPVDQNRCLEYAARLREISMTFKNDGFKEEREWRLINDPKVFLQDKKLQTYGNISELGFFANTTTIRSYLKYRFKKRLVKQIVLGPKNQLDSYDFDCFRFANDYTDTQIVRSRITYK